MDMLILSACALGLTGSLHCVSMCAPILMLVERSAFSSGNAFLRRILYHIGRIAVYVSLGLLLGSVSRTAQVAGLQTTLSLIAGIGLLVAAMYPLIKKYLPNRIFVFSVASMSKTFFSFSKQLPPSLAQFVMGIGNGLLPCGLVYSALGASLLAPTALGSGIFMFIFGVATLPALFIALFIGNRPFLRSFINGSTARSFTYAIVGILLVFRGLSLNIPYISPLLSPTLNQACEVPVQ